MTRQKDVYKERPEEPVFYLYYVRYDDGTGRVLPRGNEASNVDNVFPYPNEKRLFRYSKQNK
jgi:hypothetical protein